MFLLLFVFVFGDTLGAGLVSVSGGRGDYLDYVTPGIVVLAAAGAAQAVAWCVAIALGGYLWAKRLFNRDATP